jgi:hypothetical protein
LSFKIVVHALSDSQLTDRNHELPCSGIGVLPHHVQEKRYVRFLY